MTFFDPKLRWALAQIDANRAYAVSQSAAEVLIDLGLAERYSGFLVRATEEGKMDRETSGHPDMSDEQNAIIAH